MCVAFPLELTLKTQSPRRARSFVISSHFPIKVFALMSEETIFASSARKPFQARTIESAEAVAVSSATRFFHSLIARAALFADVSTFLIHASLITSAPCHLCAPNIDRTVLHFIFKMSDELFKFTHSFALQCKSRRARSKERYAAALLLSAGKAPAAIKPPRRKGKPRRNVVLFIRFLPARRSALRDNPED
jgi:hypothetical protein